MKHILKLHLLLFILVAGSVVAQPQHSDREVKNVILMVGDGMGLPQVGALMIENNYAPTSFDRAHAIGICKTYSANNRVTDSAAAGTAIATGHKANNKQIGMTPDGTSVTNLAELAKAAGLATGLVVTSNLADATPAAFAAHVSSRRDDKSITAAYASAGIDVLAGGGRKLFEESLDGRNIIHELQKKGYHYTSSFEKFCATESTPLLGLFADIDLPCADKRDPKYLTKLTEHTLKLLAHNNKGFFAMIEGSEIDGAGHDHNPALLLAELRDFDHAVHAAFDFADKHPGTLVIVVADHETGGLTMVSNNEDYTASESGLEYNFSTEGHSATPVVLFAYGAGAAHFAGVMDNTDIFYRIKTALFD